MFPHSENVDMLLILGDSQKKHSYSKFENIFKTGKKLSCIKHVNFFSLRVNTDDTFGTVSQHFEEHLTKFGGLFISRR